MGIGNFGVLILALAIAITAATMLYAVASFRKVLSEQTKQLQAAAIQGVGEEMLRIDRWMADHPNYFHEVRRPGPEQTVEGAAVAEVYADFIAHVMSLEDFLPEDHMDAWKTYFSQIQTWPQLDNYLEKTPDWYLPEKMEEALSPKVLSGP